uniref:Uncharacterized protein n=1 Tax=Anopheles coluzzii TaxID=1518534 RepID=A0A8W7P3W2_ANOCL
MREPIATAAPALTAGNVASVIVAPSTAATMFGITNAQIVQSFNGLPPLQADCAPAAAIVRAASRASSIGGAGRPSLKSSAAGSSGTSSPVTSVKRNSSSSSFSSGGDRRSVFYTDPEQSSTLSERFVACLKLIIRTSHRAVAGRHDDPWRVRGRLQKPVSEVG